MNVLNVGGKFWATDCITIGNEKPFSEADIQALFDGYQGIYLDATDLGTMFSDTNGKDAIVNDTAIAMALSKASIDKYGPELKDTAYGVKTGTLVDTPVADNDVWTIQRLESTANLSRVVIETGLDKFYYTSILKTSGSNINVRTSNGGTVLYSIASNGVNNVGIAKTSGSSNITVMMITNNTTASFKINSVRKILGTHTQQSTASKRPLLQNDLVKFDGSDDDLPFNFDNALSNCTIIRTTKTETTVLTGQSIPQSFLLNQDYCQYFLINRALTSIETLKIKKFFEKKAGIV